MIREQIRPTLVSLLVLTLITGIAYPLLVTGIAQTFFKNQANGSLIYQNAKAVGSSLIGQSFSDPKYLWGRPSATSPAYNAAASSGSNYGPLHADFLKGVEDRVETLKAADPGNTARVPVDLVTASGSGLDPHLSLAGAYYQVPRIARIRELSEETVKEIIQKNTQGRFLGVIGEPVVNVLKVNLELEALKQS
jgi:K+-transporting ATPase ATPase C chain